MQHPATKARRRAAAQFPFDDLAGLVPHEDNGHLARQLGVSSRTVVRYRRRRHLSELVADRLAVAAGFHPGNVWPQWFTEAAA